jgi:hypothetical protein
MDLEKIHLLATFSFGTVQTIIACGAFVADPKPITARHLDIFAGRRTNFPASRTILIASYSL